MDGATWAPALCSRRPEPLGAYGVPRLSCLHQQGRRRLHEFVRPADETACVSAQAVQQLLDGRQVDAPDTTGPARCGVPSECYSKREPRITPRECRQRAVVDDIVTCAARVQKCGWNTVASQMTVAQYAHER